MDVDYLTKNSQGIDRNFIRVICGKSISTEDTENEVELTTVLRKMIRVSDKKEKDMKTSRSIRPEKGEYASEYQYYIDLVQDGDIIEVLQRQIADTAASLASVSEAAADFRYAPDKWSIKEIAGHMGDTERVFAYRALCFARGETAKLPGFDQDLWAKVASFGARTLKSLTEELVLTRRMTISLLEHLNEEEWLREGIANENNITVRAVAYAIAGHERHHLNILRTRYKVLRPNSDSEQASSFLQ